MNLTTLLAMAEQMPPLVASHEIAELLNVSRQRVTQLTTEARYNFPDPVAVLKVGRIWNKAEVIDWARKSGRIVSDDNE